MGTRSTDGAWEQEAQTELGKDVISLKMKKIKSGVETCFGAVNDCDFPISCKENTDSKNLK